MNVGGRDIENERQRETERDREKEKTERERKTQRERERERQREGELQIERARMRCKLSHIEGKERRAGDHSSLPSAVFNMICDIRRRLQFFNF